MKRLMYLFLVCTLAMPLVTMTSCGDDDDDMDDTPTCMDGIQNGDETGVDCGGSCDPCLVGVQGEWQSSGDNVAPLIVSLFSVDSIYARFESNGTYEVHQFDTTGTMTTLTGTYSQTESSVSGFWDITLNQSTPAAITTEGIFQVTAGDPDQMRYEVVQTSPDIGATPPTAEAGFGSSSGGTLGMQNVQTYLRIE